MEFPNLENGKIIEKLRRYCAYQDRCHQEVQKKLFDLNCPYEMRDEIIVSLIREDFLNEERFAKSFARGKFEFKHWGRLKIQHELKKKEIHEKLILKAIDSEISTSKYLKKIKYLAAKKRDQLREPNLAIRTRKIKDFVAKKGFEWELIHAQIKD